MSHRITVQSKMTNKQYLLAALKALGATKIEDKGNSVVVEGNLYFNKQKDGTFVIEGDPYYCSGGFRKYYRKEQELRQDVSEQYLLAEAKTQLRKAGFKIKSSTRKTQGKNVVYTAFRI